MSRNSWVHTSFFVDPSNSTGLAKDTNNGLTNTTPILTTLEFNRRIFNHNVHVASTIFYMSDENTPAQIDLSTVSIGLGDSPGSLTFQGTQIITHTGGTLTGGTIAINPAAPGGGQRQVCHTTDITDFGPFVFTGNGGSSAHPQLLVDTVAANNPSAWIVKAATPAFPSMSKPVTTTFAAGTLSVGDAYRVQRGSLLSVAQSVQPAGSGMITFNDFAFTVNHAGFNGATYNRCSLDGTLVVGGTFNNCYLGADIVENTTSPMAAIIINSGVLIENGFGEAMTSITMSGDLYITGFQLLVGLIGYASVFVSSGIGAGIQVHDTFAAGAGGSAVLVGGVVNALTISAALLWGNGNAGLGLLLVVGSSQGVPANAVIRPTVTGALGDFGFEGTNGGATISQARPWNETAGVYGPSAATTWANFAGAAFNFQAHCVTTGASVIGV